MVGNYVKELTKIAGNLARMGAKVTEVGNLPILSNQLQAVSFPAELAKHTVSYTRVVLFLTIFLRKRTKRV